MVEKRFPGILSKGQHLFDASILSSSDERVAKSYFTFLGMLKRLSDLASPTTTHSFFSFLSSSKKLLRIYTQNIDGLERKVTLPAEKIVYLHGSLEYLCCTICAYRQTFSNDNYVKYESDGIPYKCPSCLDRVNARIVSGKRSLPVGVLTPPILLYNHVNSSKNTVPNLEVKQGDVVASALFEDESVLRRKKEIILFVVGTSCKVIGVKKLIKRMAPLSCMTVFINKTPLPQKEWNSVFNVQLIGDCDAIFEKIWKSVQGPSSITTYFRSTIATMEAAKPEKSHVENSSNCVNIKATSSPVKKTLDFYFEKSPVRVVRKFSELPITPPALISKSCHRLSISPCKSPTTNPALPFKCTKHSPKLEK
ncbi:hypothetical protein DI09_13p370 [Mitosporidium daphniae]|uniref:Deacetylase sirtuin-type domain-containing protein n=1 Tax=Mitosporidium daphniae TaxID=1485682 RepID=A0A098VUE6_9MICR|nr:uncharacterized protein DI09_13p370 [Mitosporidium daphniae]KGG52748.1 hypothetical protein DI09_13p370 [Mitosporidium daphniae]|eukprot:XP_013239175.1 uncharacterized protein DI09_13p370 [Mitosporidium daphniae]